jgi:predicted RNA-binding Zn-ribbon protein involved in translation (DUF1610 family)
MAKEELLEKFPLMDPRTADKLVLVGRWERGEVPRPHRPIVEEAETEDSDEEIDDGVCECGEQLVGNSDGDVFCPACDSPGVCISCDDPLEYDEEYEDWFCPNHCSVFDFGILEDDYSEESGTDSVCDDGN